MIEVCKLVKENQVKGRKYNMFELEEYAGGFHDGFLNKYAVSIFVYNFFFAGFYRILNCCFKICAWGFQNMCLHLHTHICWYVCICLFKLECVRDEKTARILFMCFYFNFKFCNGLCILCFFDFALMLFLKIYSPLALLNFAPLKHRI